jgi:hypothetical protein
MRNSLEIAEKQFNELNGQLSVIVNEKLPALKKRIVAAGAPAVR